MDIELIPHSNGETQVIVVDENTGSELVSHSQQYDQLEPTPNSAVHYIRSLDSKQSQETAAYVLRRVATILGARSIIDCPWHKLNYDHVQQIKRTLVDDELMPATINLYLSMVKQTCRTAWRDGVMSHETYERIKDVKPPRGSRKKSDRLVSHAEIKAMLNTCAPFHSLVDLRDAAMIALFSSCGLRRAEVAGLLDSQINVRTRRINIIGKGNKERVLIIPKATFPIVKKRIDAKANYPWKRAKPDNVFVAAHKSGVFKSSALSGNGIRKILKKRGEL